MTTPCFRGHTSGRYDSGDCIECAKQRASERRRVKNAETTAYRKRWYAANRQEQNEKRKCRRLANPQKHIDYCRSYYRLNKGKRIEKERDANRRWRNENKARVRATRRAWYAANKGKAILYVLRRRKYIQRATPQWADLTAIEAFYRACSQGFHVDHVVPLRGRTVCGLHVLENLQYLPAVMNSRKANQWFDHG